VLLLIEGKLQYGRETIMNSSMKIHTFNERVISTLSRAITEIEDAKKELNKDPFPERHYESQENYEKYLEGRGIEDLLIQMKAVMKALQERI
jgi:hypothetical protein